MTDALFCVFQRDSLWELHRQSPRLGFDITWLTAHEESVVDDALLSVGRRNAEERIAALLIVLFKRAATLQADGGAAGVPFPLTQQHLADGLGLSLVHTNKTLRKLERLVYLCAGYLANAIVGVPTASDLAFLNFREGLVRRTFHAWLWPIYLTYLIRRK